MDTDILNSNILENTGRCTPDVDGHDNFQDGVSPLAEDAVPEEASILSSTEDSCSTIEHLDDDLARSDEQTSRPDFPDIHSTTHQEVVNDFTSELRHECDLGDLRWSESEDENSSSNYHL